MEPSRRLIPPDAAAVRAARTATRPRPRGLGVLLLAVAVGVGVAAATGGDRPASTGAAASVAPTQAADAGLLTLTAAAPLRPSPGREAEVSIALRWLGTDAHTPDAGRIDAARAALAGWIATHRATELTETPDPALVATLQHALFPSGGGRLERTVVTGIRLR